MSLREYMIVRKMIKCDNCGALIAPEKAQIVKDCGDKVPVCQSCKKTYYPDK